MQANCRQPRVGRRPPSLAARAARVARAGGSRSFLHVDAAEVGAAAALRFAATHENQCNEGETAQPGLVLRCPLMLSWRLCSTTFTNAMAAQRARRSQCVRPWPWLVHLQIVDGLCW